MRYCVEVAERARSDLFDIYRWIAADSPLNADGWVAEIEKAILGLESSPERCPVAPEDGEVEGALIRQLLVGAYRALFTVEQDTVVVLHIRHGSRLAASRAEIAVTLHGTARWTVVPRSRLLPGS